MSSRLPTVLSLGLAVAAAAPTLRAENKDRDRNRETFFATVMQTANMRLPGGGTFQLTMNVDEWTSVEERKRLLVVFKEGGSEALMKELRKMKAGYISPPAFAGWPSWEVDVASSIPQPDGGRIVRLFTERPMLGIARCLGPHGIPVCGLSSSAGFPGNFSRYCKFHLAPDSLEAPKELHDLDDDTVKYRIIDKSKALAALKRYVGLYAKDNKQKVISPPRSGGLDDC